MRRVRPVSSRRRSPQIDWRVGLAAGFVAGGAAATWLGRRQLTRAISAGRRYVRRPSSVQRPVLIVNRWGGDGTAERCGLLAEAQARGVETVVLERGDDLRRLAEDAVARGADAIGMAGGDGSLGLVAAVAIERDLPFFCVPVGTRNHFALDLGLDRDDPLAALAALRGGDELRIDYGLVGDRVFLNNASFGLYAEAVQRPEYRGQTAATIMQAVVEAFNSKERRPDVRFTSPDGREHTTAAALLVSNNPYVFSGPPDFGRRERLDGGVLGIGAMAEAPPGEADASPGPIPGLAMGEWEATSYRVDAAGGTLAVGVDGEALELPAPADLRIIPGMLRMLVPSGTRPGYLTPRDRAAIHLLDVISLAGAPEPADGDPPSTAA